MKVINTLKVLAFASAMSTTASLYADMPDVNTSIKADTTIGVNKDGDETLQSKDMILDLSTQFHGIQIDMGLDVAEAIGHYLRQNGEDVNVDIDGEKLLNDLTATIDLMDGSIQIKMGKQTIQMLENSFSGPEARDPLYDIKRLQQVIAGVVSTHPAFLNAIADRIDIWIADSSEFDNKMGEGNSSYGVKIAKQLSDKFRMSASYSRLSSNEKDIDDSTGIISLSVEAALNDRLSAYGSVIDVHPDDLASKEDETYIQFGARAQDVLGGVAGVDYSRGLESKDSNIQFNLEYKLSKNVSVKPYVGVTMYDENDRDNDVEGGAEFKLKFN
ncbi:MAG: hypothetical protein KDD50_10715 [Bdellovibrionales bacterium]|nr:hypothetical protein [Bdellovibrionales bacterium]